MHPRSSCSVCFFLCTDASLLYVVFSSFSLPGGKLSIYDLWIQWPESMCVPGLSGHTVCGGGHRITEPQSVKNTFYLASKCVELKQNSYLFLKNSSQLEWLNMLIIVQMIHFYFVYVMPSLQKSEPSEALSIFFSIYLLEAQRLCCICHGGWQKAYGWWYSLLQAVMFRWQDQRKMAKLLQFFMLAAFGV